MQLLRMGGNLEEDVVAVDNPKLAGHSFGQILKKLKNSENSCGILQFSRIREFRFNSRGIGKEKMTTFVTF